MKKEINAFTLIELLSVIVILAIIALIATPIVINIIEDSKKNAFIQTANGIIEAAEYYYANEILNEGKLKETKTFEFPNEIEGLEFDGEVPNGTLKVNTEGEMALAISNGKYCITKYYTDKEIKIEENPRFCAIPYTLAAVATISESLGINEVDRCVKKGIRCTFGKDVTEPTEFAIQVNETDIYKFYVINDTGIEVTLIVDRDLGNTVAWYADEQDNSKGPLTALTELERITNDWENILIRKYYYSDDGGANKYKIEEPYLMRARMITYKEVTELGCTTTDKSCPSYLYMNCKSVGYWTSGAVSNLAGRAWYITSKGNLLTTGGVTFTGYVSNRPVITISK